MLDIEAIRARWADIIEPEDVDAPWRPHTFRRWATNSDAPDHVEYEVLDAHNDIRVRCYEGEVAAALAAARTDIPTLCAEVERLREALARAEDVIGEHNMLIESHYDD